MVFTETQQQFLFAVTCLELTLCLFAICIVSISVMIIVHIRLFHWNFTAIIVNFIVQFFIGIIAGFLSFAFSNIAIYNSFANHCDDVLYSVLAGGAFIMPSLAIERSAATVFIRDYETRSRHQIAFLVIFMQYFLAIFFTTMSDYGYSFVMLELVTLATANFFGISIFIIISRLNERRRRSLNKSFYSLSERFQLAENVRVFRIVWRFAQIAFVATISLVALYAISEALHVKGLPYHSTMVEQAVYCLLPFFVTALATIPFKGDERWRREFTRKARYFPKFFRTITSFRVMREQDNLSPAISDQLRGTDGARMIFTIDEEKRMYFEALQRAWR